MTRTASAALVALYLAAPYAQAQSQSDSTREPNRDLSHIKMPPAPALSPAQSMATFRVADGFAVELVASEPLVEDPVTLTFDADGRMWLVEMRGFMPDVDGKGENAPVGRVVVLEDRDGDGRAEHRTVFLDRLVMPRALALVKGGALVVHGSQLWMAHDDNGDHVADRSVLVDPLYAPNSNPEHAPNALFRAMDNWHYNAEANMRYRYVGSQWVRETTELRGQWGMSQDDLGRLYFNVNYDQLRADLLPPNVLSRNPHHLGRNGINVQVARSQAVFPIRLTTGVNRGYRPGVLSEEGKLLTFSAAGAPLIYRGDAYPPEFRGNAFVCEPSANLIKRNLVTVAPLALSAVDAYDGKEFLASTDERFRPVNQALGPDGNLYVVDMYRGIIQHGAYITTFLRGQILSRGLQSPIHRGRIYRIVRSRPDAAGLRVRLTPPRLGAAANPDLVAALSHPNGQVRDTAQRLLVEREARETQGALVALAFSRAAATSTRVQALWTLEALRPDHPARLLPLVAHRDPALATAAMRVLSSLATRDAALARLLIARVRALPARGPIEIRLHAALVLGEFLSGPRKVPPLFDILVRFGHNPVVSDAVLSGLSGLESVVLRRALASPRFAAERSGLTHVVRDLAAAVVRQGKAAEVAQLLAAAAAQRGRLSWRRRLLLAGITSNADRLESAPLRLASEPAVLAAPNRDLDPASRHLATVAASLLAWPGHEPSPVRRVSRQDLTAEERALIGLGQQHYQLHCGVCHGAEGEGMIPMAPPLRRSEWMRESPQTLLRVILGGLEGPIHVGGELYEPPRVMPAMPGVQGIPDEMLAALVNYARFTFAGQPFAASAVMVRQVAAEVVARGVPYTEASLLPQGSPSFDTRSAAP